MIPEAAVEAIACVIALADDWEARGEYDMASSKTIPDDDIAMEILTNGAQMVENARLVRNAIGHDAPRMNEPTLGGDVTIVRALEQIDAGEQSAPSNHLMNTGLSDAVLWSEVREWLESLASDSK